MIKRLGKSTGNLLQLVSIKHCILFQHKSSSFFPLHWEVLFWATLSSICAATQLSGLRASGNWRSYPPAPRLCHRVKELLTIMDFSFVYLSESMLCFCLLRQGPCSNVSFHRSSSSHIFFNLFPSACPHGTASPGAIAQSFSTSSSSPKVHIFVQKPSHNYNIAWLKLVKWFIWFLLHKKKLDADGWNKDFHKQDHFLPVLFPPEHPDTCTVCVVGRIWEVKDCDVLTVAPKTVDKNNSLHSDDNKLHLSYCCCHPLPAHGNPRSHPLPGHNQKPCQHETSISLYVSFYFGSEQGIENTGVCFLNRHIYFPLNWGKVEQESLSDKLNSLNCSLKHSVGRLQSCASPPVLSSIEGCNCRSFIHHCQQTVS